MKIIKYNSDTHKEEWNSFIAKSKNGTFLLNRNFMDYHSDRFSDHSLLFFEKEELIAVLPANLKDDILYSHQGLTYGGLIMNISIKTPNVLDIFSELISFLQSKNIKKLIYKAIPHIYHKYLSEEDSYALFRNNAELISRCVSSTIDQRVIKPGYSQLRKRQIKKAIQQGITVSESGELNDFWEILYQNLQEKHETAPVHTLNEISSLKQKFPQQIRLFKANKDNKCIAGCLVFETDTVAHIQYISANNEGKQYGALDLLFDELINNIFAEKRYFDFGISTEDGGKYLNEGLISQKEGFGARATIYDTYILNIQ